MKFRTLKILRARRIVRKKIKAKQTTDRWVRLIVILCFLTLMILPILAGCSSNVCPDQTKIEVGVTETDAKNDKLQEKKLLTQTFKWGKKKCNDG